MNRPLLHERIKRPIDEAACDWCSMPLYVGDAVVIDLEAGAAYCTEACAENDRPEKGGRS